MSSPLTYIFANFNLNNLCKLIGFLLKSTLTPTYAETMTDTINSKSF